MMTIEIHDLLALNLNRVVRVEWDDGKADDVIVLSVDDEGFVYDLVPPDPKTPYWSRLEEILAVAPHPGR
jgi:hypothetical protein